MADKIKLSIVSQEGPALERDVSYVNIPTPFGSLGILSGHAALLCAVEEGTVRFRFGEEEETDRIPVGAGVAHVEDNQVTLLVSWAEKKEP